MYDTSEEAYIAASNKQNQMREQTGQQLKADLIKGVYESSRNINDAAKIIGVSVPTAIKFTNELGIKKRPVGYNKNTVPFSGQQCRQAREFLRYTRDELCESSGVSKTALRCFELNKSTPRAATIEKLQAFFKARDIDFSSCDSLFFKINEASN